MYIIILNFYQMNTQLTESKLNELVEKHKTKKYDQKFSF